MKFYAQLNENNICIAISRLSGEVIQENMIEIQSEDSDKLWRKYENSAWSTEKFEPESTAPISEFEEMKAENIALRNDLSNAVMELSMLIAMGGM